jgi:hypothetical protein
MGLSIVLLVGGLLAAALIFVLTGGHFVFLPLILILPFGLLRLRRRPR